MYALLPWLTTSIRNEKRQGLAEHAPDLALTGVIVIAALVFLGTQISTILTSFGDQL